MSSEEESTDLLSYRRKVQETQQKQANWQAQCFYTFSKIRVVKFASSQETTHAPCRNRPDALGDRVHLPHKVGDAITADRKVHYEENESRMQHRHAVVVKDLCSHRNQTNPMKNKTAQETIQSFEKIVPQDERSGIIHTENSLEQVSSIPIRDQRNCRKRRSWRPRRYF